MCVGATCHSEWCPIRTTARSARETSLGGVCVQRWTPEKLEPATLPYSAEIWKKKKTITKYNQKINPPETKGRRGEGGEEEEEGAEAPLPPNWIQTRGFLEREGLVFRRSRNLQSFAKLPKRAKFVYLYAKCLYSLVDLLTLFMGCTCGTCLLKPVSSSGCHH